MPSARHAGGTLWSTPGAIGSTIPAAGTFTPLVASAPAKIEAFTSTITGAIRTLTFDSAVDWALAKVGSTIIANAETRIIIAIGASPTVTVDANTTWGAGMAITSLQDPISQEKDADGKVVSYVNALGGIGLIGGFQHVRKGLAFNDGDSGWYEYLDDDLIAFVGGGNALHITSGQLTGLSTGYFGLNFAHVATVTTPVILPKAFDRNTGIGGSGDDQLSLIAGGVEGIRISEDTTILINANGWLAMKEMAADPAALTDHAFLYAKDVGTVGNMFVADAAADATQISPHNFELFEPDPNEAYPWSYYSENKALGKKINVDMAGAIRAIEVLTGKTFIHYADIVKSVDLEATYKEQWKEQWIKDNTTETEVTKEEALEMVEVDESTSKSLGENITGYELVDGEVKPKVEVVWEMKKVQKSQLKEGINFNETDGKFYIKAVPSKTKASNAAKTGFVFEAPKWLKDRLIAQVEPIKEV